MGSDAYTAGRQASWARWVGDADMDAVSNELEVGAGHATTQLVGERVTTALASEDQFYQESFAIASAETAASVCGVAVRKHATLATDTYYRGVKYHDNGNYRIQKVVAGVVTDLATSGNSMWTVGAFHTLKLTVVGSTLTFYVDGVSTLTTTDSSISGLGAYVGHVAQGLFPTYIRLDDASWDVIATGQTVAVGVATETDSALAVAAVTSGRSSSPPTMLNRLKPYLVR